MAIIVRHYKSGPLLAVADLNRIAVLIDRSETALTEVGLNTWPAGLNGPPHDHQAKEQVFYVTSGTGSVIVGGRSARVRAGSFVYVPAGAPHQTVADAAGPLEYLLFNAFLDETKEGHASFAEHIERVKATRKAQAERAAAGEPPATFPAPAPRGKAVFVSDVHRRKRRPAGAGQVATILDGKLTQRCQAALITFPAGSGRPPLADADREKTIFVESGAGRLTAAGRTNPVRAGDVVFVPRNVPTAIEAGESDLVCLVVATMLDVPPRGARR